MTSTLDSRGHDVTSFWMLLHSATHLLLLWSVCHLLSPTCMCRNGSGKTNKRHSLWFILLFFFGWNGTNQRSLYFSSRSLIIILFRSFKMYCILKTKYSTFSIWLLHTFLNIKMIRSGSRPILWESPWLKRSACGCCEIMKQSTHL